MASIILSRGLYAEVDDADLHLVNRHTWSAVTCGTKVYARRRRRRGDPERPVVVYMHSVLLGGVQADHRDGNGLNNRRHNLRPATTTENNRNARKRRRPAQSRFKGVYRSACKSRPWRALATIDGRWTFLGNFKYEFEAALAYDRAARKHHGEFACLNFPDVA